MLEKAYRIRDYLKELYESFSDLCREEDEVNSLPCKEILNICDSLIEEIRNVDA